MITEIGKNKRREERAGLSKNFPLFFRAIRSFFQTSQQQAVQLIFAALGYCAFEMTEHHSRPFIARPNYVPSSVPASA